MKFQNVVLLVADTLRAKNLPAYGGEDKVAEFLNDKSHIDNYYSNSPWTVPAHASIFTGKLPSEHGSTTENTFFESENSLVRKFNDEGFRTVGLSENGLVRPELGFDRGFDYFGDPHNYYEGAESWNEIWKRDTNYTGRGEKLVDFTRLFFKNRDFASVKALFDYETTDFNEEDINPSRSEYSVERALEFLNEDQKTFLFLNLMPVHAPYTFNLEQKEKFLSDASREEIEASTNFDTLTDYLEEDDDIDNLFEKREKAYNASISYLDGLLEKMYDAAPSSTLFILIGDHGELIGEYEKMGSKLVDHHFGTFKELIQVPCYLYSKGEELDLRKEGTLFDHTSLHDFLKNLAEGKVRIEGDKIVRSEYFGKSGFNDQMNLEIPDKFRELFERKSFSLINEEFKTDFASDGRFFWDRDPLTESEQISEKQVPEELIEKGEILYQWRLEE